MSMKRLVVVYAFCFRISLRLLLSVMCTICRASMAKIYLQLVLHCPEIRTLLLRIKHIMMMIKTDDSVQVLTLTGN